MFIKNNHGQCENLSPNLSTVTFSRCLAFFGDNIMIETFGNRHKIESGPHAFRVHITTDDIFDEIKERNAEYRKERREKAATDGVK